MAKKTKKKTNTRTNGKAAKASAQSLTVVTKLIEELSTLDVTALAYDQSLEDARQLQDRLDNIKIEALAIDSPTQYQEYGSYLRKVKVLDVTLEKKRKEQKEPHLKASREVDAKFKGFQNLAERIRAAVIAPMDAWDAEQTRIQNEEEAAARRKQEAEQKRLDAKAAKKATRLEKQGKEEEAAEVIQNVPRAATPVIPAKNTPKLAGISSRQGWKCEVEDVAQQKELLIQAVDAFNANREEKEPKLIPGAWWNVDEQALGSFVRSTKGKVKISGVRIESETRRAVGA